MDNPIDITNKNTTDLTGNVGSEFTISVEGNLTTGFCWYLDTNKYNENEVLCTNKKEHNQGDYQSGNNTANGGMMMCGAPGKCIFKFRLVKAGTYEVGLVYKRHWEQSTNKQKVIKFTATE